MKRLLYILLLLPVLTGAQSLKISEMPLYIGNPAGSYVPVVFNGTNRKIEASYFGYDRVQTITVGHGPVYDTINVYKNGVKTDFHLVSGATSLGNSFIKNPDNSIDVDPAKVPGNALLKVYDQNVTVPSNVGVVVYMSLTASRLVTLPAPALNKQIWIRNGGNGTYDLTFNVLLRQNATTQTGTLPLDKEMGLIGDGTEWIIFKQQ